MGSISDFLENELLDHIFNVVYNRPTNLFLGLSTADPLDTGAGLAEPSDGAYSRATITFGAAAARAVTQNAKLTFAQATAAWGVLTHYGVFDAVSAGNMLAHGSLTVAKNVVSGNTPSVATSEVAISFTAGEISDYLSNALLDHAFSLSTFAVPDTFIAMCTGDVLDTDTGSTISETSAGAYAREEVDVNGGASPTWDLAANGSLDNTHTISFTQATGSWSTITALAIVDALTVGNLLFYENTVTDQEVDNGDTAEISAGNLKVSLS
jgi:hypothetical protein